MKKILLTTLAILPGFLYAQSVPNKTIKFNQAFDSSVSSNVADYKMTAAGGSPIADDTKSRLESFGTTTAPTGTSYSVDGDGLKINRTSGGSQATAQIKNLSPINGAEADFAVLQFDLTLQSTTANAPGDGSRLLVYTGDGFNSNANGDQNDVNYMTLGFYTPTANSNTFAIKVGNTGVGTFNGTQTIRWVINRTASDITYVGPNGLSNIVASANYDIWVGNTKIDLSGVTITPTNAGKALKDFRFRNAATWVGYTAFKNIKVAYMKTDGSANLNDNSFNVFSQSFDNNISSTLADYKLTSNGGNVSVGTTGGPITDDNTKRLSSIPNPSSAKGYFTVDADGFKINRIDNTDFKQTVHAGNLNIADDGVAYAQFDFNLSAKTYITYTPVILFFGEGYNNSSADEGTKNYAALNIKFPADNQFFIQDAAYTFSGSQKITWIVNRNSQPVKYLGLDGVEYILTADGGYNVWVGTTRLEAGGVALGYGATASNSGIPKMKDFRIRCAAPWPGSNNWMAFKNLEIGEITPTEILPVKITSFTAKANGSSVNLNWATSTEVNASHYNVTRSIDGGNFTKIGQVAAKNTAANYRFTDFSPAQGANYYQLEQQDLNGHTEKSEVVSATILSTGYTLDFTSVSAQNISLNINSPIAQSAQITLLNQLGQVIAKQTVNLQQGNNAVSFSTAYKGLIIATASSASGTISKKTVK